MTWELISRNPETLAVLGSVPYDQESDARAAFENCKAHARSMPGRAFTFELWRDGDVVKTYDQPARQFDVGPDGNTKITERPPER